MNEIRCLYIDDSREDLSRFKNTLELAWNSLGRGVPIIIETIWDPMDVKDRLRGGDFHMLVADVFFKSSEKDKSPKRLGLMLMSEAREMYPNLAIIALSVGDSGMEAVAMEEARADGYVSKAHLYENPKSGRTRLANVMLNALHKHGCVPAPLNSTEIKAGEESLQLEALMEVVGPGNILAFCCNLIDEPLANIKVSFVRAGLSGAAVIRAECELITKIGESKRNRDLLLKISKDISILETELDKGRFRLDFPDHIFVSLLDKGPVFSGGWFCIAALFVKGARTLLDWLVEMKPSTQIVGRTLSGLFLNRGLASVYAKAGWAEDVRPIDPLLKSLHSRKARIDLGVRELSTLARKYALEKCSCFQQDMLVRAVGPAQTICGLGMSDFPKGTAICWSHGDLHSRNILVDESNVAVLIDRANVGEFHWATDLARLSVDLFVSGLDSFEDSNDWINLGRWYELVSDFVDGRDMRQDLISSQNVSVCYALNWIRRKLPDIHSTGSAMRKREWEFVLALGFEFLRCSYRVQVLPTPKRILGLYGACRCLQRVQSLLKEGE